MDGINWGALVQRQNPFGAFSEGLQQGSQMRMDQERQNLFRQKAEAEARAVAKAEAEDQGNRLERGILGHMARTDLPGAQAKAVEVGQNDLADQYGKLDESQRKAAAERAGVLVAYVESFGDKPPQEIKAQIEQDADALMELGFKREQIMGFDPSPQGLAILRAKALGLKGTLEQLDREGDNKRAEQIAAESARHNKVLEGQGNARVDISRGQLGISRSNSARGWASHNARVKAGGYGTPGVGGVAIQDEDVEID